MSGLLNDNDSQYLASTSADAIHRTTQSMMEDSAQVMLRQTSPSVLYRPALTHYPHLGQWQAKLGSLEGYGNSPEEAVSQFDERFYQKKAPVPEAVPAEAEELTPADVLGMVAAVLLELGILTITIYLSWAIFRHGPMPTVPIWIVFTAVFVWSAFSLYYRISQHERKRRGR